MAIFSRRKVPASQVSGMSAFKAGLIALVLIALGVFFAYTRANPFASPYQLSAVFETAQNLEPGAPVRTAGVNTGVVKAVEPLPDGSGAARVEMELEDTALPIHEDAELKIRPRIFLEGNSFVDLQPGSPSSPEIADGGTIPINQTATPVSFAEVLTSLQSDTRDDLRTFFAEYGMKALQGEGARGFRRSIRYWQDAYRDTAIASSATLGTEEGDLGRVLRGQQRTFAALSRDPEALKNLITNFNTTAAALASQDDALQAAVPALRDALAVGRPALQSINSSLPQVRAFARDALPGTRSSLRTIRESFPFIRQSRLLFARRELRGLAGDLRVAIPDLARLNRATIPFLQQNRALSRCVTEVLEPFANDTDWTDAGPDREQSGEPWRELAPRALEGLSGESRLTDANSPVFRVLGLGGPETVVNTLERTGEQVFGATAFKPNAVQPPSPLRPDGQLALPQHRPDVPCENQEPPDLHAPAGTPGGSDEVVEASAPSSSSSLPDDAAGLAEEAMPRVEAILERLRERRPTALENLSGLRGESKLEQLKPRHLEEAGG